jgi:hypothetical protein
MRNHYLQQLVCYCVYSLPRQGAYRTVAQQWTIPRLFVCRGNVRTELLRSNGHIRLNIILSLNDPICSDPYTTIIRRTPS